MWSSTRSWCKWPWLLPGWTPSPSCGSASSRTLLDPARGTAPHPCTISSPALMESWRRSPERPSLLVHPLLLKLGSARSQTSTRRCAGIEPSATAFSPQEAHFLTPRPAFKGVTPTSHWDCKEQKSGSRVGAPLFSVYRIALQDWSTVKEGSCRKCLQ